MVSQPPTRGTARLPPLRHGTPVALDPVSSAVNRCSDNCVVLPSFSALVSEGARLNHSTMTESDCLNHTLLCLPTSPCVPQEALIEQFISIETLTKLISYAIIAGSAIVKIPQIVNVLKAKSARGLNLNAVYLETVATLLGTSYNILIGNPFRTYGETALILLQNIIIVLLVWNYSTTTTSQRITASSVFVGLAAILFNSATVLDPVWPGAAKDLGLTPLNCMYNGMTLLYVCARVRKRGEERVGAWVTRWGVPFLSTQPW